MEALSKSRAQGAIEYLLLIAGALLIVAVVLVVLAGMGKGVSNMALETGGGISYPCVEEGEEVPCIVKIGGGEIEGIKKCVNTQWTTCFVPGVVEKCYNGTCGVEICEFDPYLVPKTDNDCKTTSESGNPCYYSDCYYGDCIAHVSGNQAYKRCTENACKNDAQWYDIDCCEAQSPPDYLGGDTEKPESDGSNFILCSNGLDDDCDSYKDCADSQCKGAWEESEAQGTCNDNIDNDCDGKTDYEDDDLDCKKENEVGYCNTGEDEDDDGLTDCCDSDCSVDSSCSAETQCTDNADNDCDSLSDCYDDDCDSEQVCGLCGNGIVDDEPGYTEDCDPNDPSFPADCEAKYGTGITGEWWCYDKFANASDRCTIHDTCEAPNNIPDAPVMGEPTTPVQTWESNYAITLTINDTENDNMTVQCFAGNLGDTSISCNNTLENQHNGNVNYSCNLTNFAENVSYPIWCRVRDDQHGANDWVNSTGVSAGTIEKIPYPIENFTLIINDILPSGNIDYRNTLLDVDVTVDKDNAENNVSVKCYMVTDPSLPIDVSNPNNKYCGREEMHNFVAGLNNFTYKCPLVNGLRETDYYVGCIAHSSAGNTDAENVSGSSFQRIVPVYNPGAYYDYDDVLVVFNANNVTSSKLAEYYAGIHKIENQKCGIAGLGTSETISENDFQNLIMTGVDTCLDSISGIKYIALMKGLPLKITNSSGDVLASVDSALTLVKYGFGYNTPNPYAGTAGTETKDYELEECGFNPVPNLPTYSESGQFNISNLYLVTRIDSFPDDTDGDLLPDDSKQLIDDVFEVNTGASKTLVFDYLDQGTNNAKCRLNTLIHRASEVLPANSVIVDKDNSVCDLSETNVAVLISGGKDFDSEWTCDHTPNVNWLKGSISELIAPNTAYSHNGGHASPTQTLGIDLINDGASGSSGVVTSGFDNQYSDPYHFVKAYADGCVLADSYYLGSKYLAGIEIKIGDPKMHAFTGGCS
ncbi:MAG: hypothetical protein V1672_02035 [Candidatus Diapherotrites archaeon]